VTYKRNTLDCQLDYHSTTRQDFMALKPPPPPWEILQQVSELIGGRKVSGEVDKSMRSLAQSALSRLDMVSREEFDTQAEILKRTRSKVASLEAELEALTSGLERLTTKR
tara:strand:+ start:883 stop:1212 length:330 start_codon:yes stop_codon:yes gene_type:complete